LSGAALARARAAPLDGLLVVDLSQFLAGPLASLRLADMGARVIKVERPDGGDLCRRLYLTDTAFDGDSTLFHAINRNKQSFQANLKNPDDLDAVRKLIARADVLIQNFRPGVIERIGLGADAARALNPRLVYASITGYGHAGEWASLPGQDLLAQARSGVMWLGGAASQGPVPVGLSIADMLAGNALTQAILAALVRRGIDGQGASVETSLLEAMVDLQFELLATHLNDGQRPPQRAAAHGANAYLAAPYGVFATRDGHLALAMTPLERLASLLGLPGLVREDAPGDAAFRERDAILATLGAHFAQRETAHWLAVLQPADVWCAEVLDWPAMLAHESFRGLDMLQTIGRDGGTTLTACRLPMRFDGRRPASALSAPRLGEHTAAIRREFGL
jgi:CoA:oxalate CoA-transferase